MERKNRLYVGGSRMCLMLGDECFEINADAHFAQNVAEVIAEIHEKLETADKERYNALEMCAVLKKMMDKLLGEGAAERVFGVEMPDPVLLADGISFIINQYAKKLEDCA